MQQPGNKAEMGKLLHYSSLQSNLKSIKLSGKLQGMQILAAQHAIKSKLFRNFLLNLEADTTAGEHYRLEVMIDYFQK